MSLRLLLIGLGKQTLRGLVKNSNKIRALKIMSADHNTSPGNIADMRKPYKGENEYFDIEHLASKEPFGQFQNWFETACKTDGIVEANAMSLSTATKDGKPSSRMVLLKGYDKEGFKFFTNYESRKGKELEENPNAAVLFYWTNATSNEATWSRQIRIEGRVEKLSEEESTAYYHSRPKDSQIGACISHQSSVIPSRKTLTDKNEQLKNEYANKECPKPSYWGGYRLRPDNFEFWQGQTNRLHDRFLFRKLQQEENINPELTHNGENGWVFERLSS